MYPSIPKRIKAATVDSIIIIISFILLMVVYKRIGDDTPIFGILSFLLVFLYEPILVCWKGRTLGHRLYNFRVVDVETTQNISFIKAVVRFLIKSILGIFSLFWAIFTNRQQSLHDIATNSAVISDEVTDASLEKYGLPEKSYSSDQVEIVQSSITRRISVSLIWFVVFFFIISFFYEFFMPECLEDSSSRISLCRYSEDLLGYIIIAILIICLVLGSKGKLLGAKGKYNPH